MYKFIKKNLSHSLQNGNPRALSNSSNRSHLGKEGEEFVVANLQSRGYFILDCNYRKRFGEIDIIAKKGNVIAFVEVKARITKYFNLSEVINYSKQKKIILTAKHYVMSKGIKDKVLRFDIALVEKQNNAYNLNYIKNAFTSNNE